MTFLNFTSAKNAGTGLQDEQDEQEELWTESLGLYADFLWQDSFRRGTRSLHDADPQSRTMRIFKETPVGRYGQLGVTMVCFFRFCSNLHCAKSLIFKNRQKAQGGATWFFDAALPIRNKIPGNVQITCKNRL